MSKEVLFDEEVLDRIQKGIDEVNNTVKRTLGPNGKNVILEKMVKSPQITNDGAYVVREIELDGTDKHTGSEIIKQASIATSENSGDGTTSSVVLGHEFFSKARKAVSGGVHPTFLKRGMDKALRHALSFLHDFCFPVEYSEEIEHVASMSAGGDEALGELIAEAIEMVGKDGIIRVEESEGVDTYLEFSEGMQIDRGYLSHEFIEDTENDQTDLEEPFVYIADKRLTTMDDVLRPMEYAHQNNRPLFVIAHDIEDQALATLIQNHNEGNLDCCAVRAPRVDRKRSEILDSLGVLTNGAAIKEETGISPVTSDPDIYLGVADSISVNHETTTIIGGEGDKDDIKMKIKSLRTQLENSGSEHDKEFYQKLVSQMSGGMAIIRAGGQTETELKEHKANVEDALSATKAAVRSGIIPGGGVTYLEIQDYLQEMKDQGEVELQNYEEERGWDIFAESLDVIFTQILDNAEYNPDIELFKYKQSQKDDSNVGLIFDVRDGEVKDAYQSGVIEPAMVADDVLRNSVSVASTLITSSCMIYGDDKEDGDGMTN
jgi:chaperonin GroEL